MSFKDYINERMTPGTAKRIDEVIDTKVIKNLRKILDAFYQEMAEEGFEVQDTIDYVEYLIKAM